MRPAAPPRGTFVAGIGSFRAAPLSRGCPCRLNRPCPFGVRVSFADSFALGATEPLPTTGTRPLPGQGGSRSSYHRRRSGPDWGLERPPRRCGKTWTLLVGSNQAVGAVTSLAEDPAIDRLEPVVDALEHLDGLCVLIKIDAHDRLSGLDGPNGLRRAVTHPHLLITGEASVITEQGSNGGVLRVEDVVFGLRCSVTF